MCFGGPTLEVLSMTFDIGDQFAVQRSSLTVLVTSDKYTFSVQDFVKIGVSSNNEGGHFIWSVENFLISQRREIFFNVHVIW